MELYKLHLLQGSNVSYEPYEKELSGKYHQKCPESVHVVQKISGKCLVKWSNLLSGIFYVQKKLDKSWT
jgi:hypothetical protein